MPMSKFQYAEQDIEGEWRGARNAIVCGVRFPSNTQLLHTNFEEDLPHFHTRQDDVFVASFPKSGTTWLQELVWQIYHNGETSMEKIKDRVPCLDFSKLLEKGNTGDEKRDSKPALENLPSPRLLKSHLPYHVIPKGDSEATKCKYIYVARNPKDVAVSHYHFTKDFGDEQSHQFRGPWEFFAEQFVQGKVSYNLWSDHVLGWWKHKDDPNVLFLKYEDLKKDLEGNVKKVADFLEKTLSKETVKRIAQQCTFQGMSQNAPAYWALDSAQGPRFMRKGKVGDWKNYFTPELNAKFETELLAKLEGTGLHFDFSE